MKALQVFCGSNAGNDPVFAQITRQLADLLVKEDITLVYGGGDVGLMGILADRMLEQGGTAVGVIPTFLQEREVCHAGLTELILVDSMHERKIIMAERSQGVVVLPGGFGTMDELFEMLTLVQLSQLDQPIGLLNVNGFYDLLLRQLDHMLAMGFLKPDNRAMVLEADGPVDLLHELRTYTPQEKPDKWGYKL